MARITPEQVETLIETLDKGWAIEPPKPSEMFSPEGVCAVGAGLIALKLDGNFRKEWNERLFWNTGKITRHGAWVVLKTLGIDADMEIRVSEFGLTTLDDAFWRTFDNIAESDGYEGRELVEAFYRFLRRLPAHVA